MDPFHVVKVFTATRAADRESLGEKLTSWLRAHPEYRVVRTIVTQSSDKSFHCLSITLFLITRDPG
jgi:hypothetical protein